MSSFAGDCLNADQSLLNFGNLALKKTLDEARVGARQSDASTAVSAFDGNDERTQAGAVGVVLAGNLF